MHAPREEPRARLAARVKRVALTVLLLLTTLASAQEKHNFLAVNGALVDDAGPYYFIAQGDNRNAFAKAAPLAQAMDLSLHYDPDGKRLRFSDGSANAVFEATGDIQRGLVKRDGVLSVGGRALASPMAILIDGTAYVPISPLVDAFDGRSEWNAERHIITVDTADRLGYALAPPRIGLTDGVSRVALDLPAGAEYQLAVSGDAFIVTLPGARAAVSDRTVDDPNLRGVALRALDGEVNLVVRTRYGLDGEGHGYHVGVLDKGDGRTLYVDFATSLKGDPVAALLSNDPAAPQALSAAPARPQVVVIDAGHGGKDPGTTSSYAVEDQVVLSVALKLKKRLEAQDVRVVLTRDHDTFLTLQQRSGFATPERNLFVSIHANSAPAHDASGIETWVFGKPLDPSLVDRAIRENGGGAEGQALTEAARHTADDIAGDILRETQMNFSMSLADSVQQSLVRATGARDRGVRQNLFYVIRTARIPAILVEVGFVSNPEEGRMLATDHYQDTLAQALAGGILDFLHGGGMLAQR